MLKQTCDDDIVVYLVGNKADLVNMNTKLRRVSKDEAVFFSKGKSFQGFGECSALRNTNINVKSFDHVPTIADLERTEDIQEYMIAYAMIQGEYLDIPEGVIFDTRMDQSVCGLITSLYRELDSKAIHQQCLGLF